MWSLGLHAWIYCDLLGRDLQIIHGAHAFCRLALCKSEGAEAVRHT